MSTLKKKLFSNTVNIQWGDMDSLGHVNNVVYFKYFESVRVLWFDSVKSNMLNPKGEGPILIHTQSTYLKELVYPDTIEITMFAGQVGNSSFNLLYEIKKQNQAEICTLGESKMVWSDIQARKSKTLPDFVRQYFI